MGESHLSFLDLAQLLFEFITLLDRFLYLLDLLVLSVERPYFLVLNFIFLLSRHLLLDDKLLVKVLLQTSFLPHSVGSLLLLLVLEEL